VAIVVVIIEKKLGNNRRGTGVDFILQVSEIGDPTFSSRMNLGKTRHRDGEAAKHYRLANELRRMVKTVWVGLPIHHSLGWIATECKKILNSFFFQLLE